MPKLKTIREIYFAFLCLAIMSCKNPNDEPPGICDDVKGPLGVLSEKDTIKISVTVSDCGEWGGHFESILLRRQNNTAIARLTVDSVSCKRLRANYEYLEKQGRVIHIDTIKALSIEDEKSISIFLQRILELYLKDEVHSNAGNYFTIINSDSSLNLSYWNSGDCRDTYYEKMKKQVFSK